MINQKQIVLMGLVTLIVFPLIGATIIGVVEADPWHFPFVMSDPWWKQLLIGLLLGLIGAVGVIKLLAIPYMQPVVDRYNPLFNSLKINLIQAIFLSLCAGIGEELLFRVVIQHYWGIPITSLFFVAIHGYLNPKLKPLVLYGVILTAYIAVLGFAYERSGFIAASTAHFIFDLILFYKLVLPQETNHA